jgi:TolA-binding protein
MVGNYRSVVLFTLVIVSGCSNGRIEQIDRSLEDLRALQAEQTIQVETVSAELRTLRGRVEELEYSQKQKLGGEVRSIKDELSTLRRRVPPPAIVPSSLLEDDEGMVQSLPPEVGERFGMGLQNLREGQFREAVPLFQSALDASVGQSYAANILFWLGVSYDGLNDTRNGLLAYSQIISNAPKHPLVPAAFLRQAAVLERMRDTKTAIIILKKLIADYPKTAEAAQARERLKRLG